MCCTSGDDGCCSACEENVLVEHNLSTNYFASISNGNRLFCECNNKSKKIISNIFNCDSPLKHCKQLEQTVISAH